MSGQHTASCPYKKIRGELWLPYVMDASIVVVLNGSIRVELCEKREISNARISETSHQTIFTTVRSEGAILPMDLLQRYRAGDANMQGLTLNPYHLLKSGEAERGD